MLKIKETYILDKFNNNSICRTNSSWGISKDLTQMSLLPTISINKKSIPFVIILKITQRCNLNCKYCYSKTKSNIISSNIIDIICNKILSFKKPVQIIFHGGEPLLEFNKIKYIVLKLKDKNNISFSVQTNGILLSKSVIDFFKNYNVNVCISIDGPKEFHNLYRKNFNKVYNSIKTCKNLGLEPSLICVLNNLSVKKPEVIFNFIKKLNIKRFKFNLIDSDKLEYTCNDVFSFYKKLFELIIKNNLCDNFKIYDLTLSNLAKKLLFGITTDYCNIFNCGAGKDLISIAVNGDVYPCDYFCEFGDFKLGNIKFIDLNKIPRNKEFEIIFDNNLKKCSDCVFQDFVYCNCVAKSYFYGNKYCEFWKKLINFIMLKIYNNISDVGLLINS